MIAFFKKLDKSLAGILDAMQAFFVAAVVILTFWQVLCRHVFLISTAYAEELSRLGIVWCIYLGCGYAVRSDEHMRVSAISDRLLPLGQLLLRIMSALILIAFGVVMIIWGCKYIGMSATDTTTTLGYHRYWFYVPGPLCGLLTVVYSISDIIIRVYEFIARGNSLEKKGEEKNG